jgi:hypothetical protein
VGAEVTGLKPCLETTMQHDRKCTAGQFGDLAQVSRHGHAPAHAQSDRFAERFLGQKARGQVAHTTLQPALAAGLPGRELARAEYLGTRQSKPCSVTV